MFSFIEGATITGFFEARSVVKSKLSEIPEATFAIKSAVAGTTAIRSDHLESARCIEDPLIIENWSLSVYTSSAPSERKEKGVTNLSPPLVITTLTFMPFFTRSLRISSDLYAATPPVTARSTLFPISFLLIQKIFLHPIYELRSIERVINSWV
ncbi:hypothetical protein CSE_10490 [Caldisericum exile AZM16c01]|uniref:Uncharacterized protein n=1 Tax=Caldisericum exile (strain DSM 21853 / NBRC 104410 / AZM16c01) TaxID=511051 RepID=A0A7U6GF07_CALEA|nr:hypothetical protein CSE_10490 [Caldisericum exile AZM16c01]